MHEVEQGLFLDILLLGGPTTNIIEGFHRQLRKITKTKTMFSSDAIWGDAIWGQVSNWREMGTGPVSHHLFTFLWNVAMTIYHQPGGTGQSNPFF